MASCGDVPTMESLAATALLRRLFPDVKVRFVNVIDLFKLVPNTEHPHGMTDREFEALFTPDKPVIFNLEPVKIEINLDTIAEAVVTR
jgi:xylulose-5-phosphate/fructose-6-phosphate phosphoketolase